MRKKTIKCLFDNVFWYAVYMLPLILMCIAWVKTGSVSLSSVMTSGGFAILSDNIVFSTLSQLFGSTGILPIFTTPDILMFATYFVFTMIIHLAVDVLLFIVRLAHDWLEGIFGKNYD